MDGPVLSAPNICYELAEKTKAIAHGGIGAIHRLVQRVGLATRIDTDVRVLKVHQPYYESDHVLNIAYNLLCGGQTLDDIELRRTARVFLDALGTDSLPDPTTAGDFCRRFDEEQIEALMDAINETRLEVWQRCPGLVEETARIDGDGTLVPTTGACKEGMDIAYNGVWGYGPLLVSLANTGEPLFIKNRSANRPSHESAIPYFDKAVALCRRAGFTDVLLRGDTDFALTTAFDRWTTAGVRFVFGYDATATMVRWGQSAPPDLYEALVRRTERTLATAPRQRPANVKDRIVTDRGFKKITTVSEALVDFDYQPTTCTRPYRVPGEQPVDHASPARDDLARHIDERAEEGAEVHSQQLSLLRLVAGPPAGGDGKLQRDPGLEAPGQGRHHHIGPVGVQRVHRRVERPDAALQLRDQVLLVAALPGLVHDFVAREGAVVRDVEKVPDVVEEHLLPPFDGQIFLERHDPGGAQQLLPPLTPPQGPLPHRVTRCGCTTSNGGRAPENGPALG